MKTPYGIKVIWVIFTLCSFFVGTGCEMKKTAVAKEEKKDKNGPCALLSKEEVEAVLKQKLEEPKRDDTICIYESVQRSPSVFLKVQLNPVEADIFMQNRKDFMSKDTFKSIDGVGENAYFFNGELNILAKNHGLSMRIEGGQTSEDDIVGLAKKAVERIQ